MTANLRARVKAVLILSGFVVGVVWGQTIQIDPLSVTSLSLKIRRDAAEIGVATGFVVKKGERYYLVTNRHVVLGCGQDQNPANVGAWICANKLAIYHNQLGRLGSWVWVTEDLYDSDGKPRWFEHPTLNGAADIVALPLANTGNVQFYPLDMNLEKADVVISPGESVSIVGFPFGLAQEGGLPVWKTGTVASDLDINFRGKPVFLVDTTSRPGMSGSPVYALRSGYVHTSKANVIGGGPVTKFLGVYSEQMPLAEIGGVWKAGAVAALYDSLP
jgi:hypothetical protein